MNVQIGQTTLVELLPNVIAIVVLSFFLVFCIVMLIKSSKAKGVQKKKAKTLNDQGVTNTATAIHVNGLPVAEGVACNIMTYMDRVEFQSGTTHINLDRKKITDMCLKTETEIQQQYVSSVGGAVGGAVVFGPLGAMIGGRAKKKTAKTTTYYLIITYKNMDEEFAFLGFNVSTCFFVANKIVKEFHQLNTNSATHIDL